MRTFNRSMIVLLLILLWMAPMQAFAANLNPIDSSKLEKIDKYVKEQFELAGLSGGSYAIVNKEAIVQAEGIGYSDLASRREATPDTVFAVASVTKAMTAAVILKLAEAGKIDLDAPVKDYLPWFQYKDRERSANVTVRHLLTHSAGVSRYAADGAIYEDIAVNRNSREHAARTLQNVDMNSEPGVKGQYCNTCYNLLGLVMETVTQQPYEIYMRDQLFEPLGMNSTRFLAAESTDMDAGVAKEYGYLFGFRTQVDPYWKEFGSSQAPEGGAYSSATDLGRFVSAVLGFGGDAFFTSGQLQAYTKTGVQASDLSDSVYTASGFEARKMHGTPILVKSGEGMGSSSSMILLPNQRTGIVLLTGETDGENCKQIASGIAAIMLDQQPESVEGVPNVMQVLGYISLGLLILSLLLLLWLVVNFVQLRRNQLRIRRRWAVILRLCLFGFLSVPFWYLLLKVRPTEAGFYGYPYDAAIAMSAAAVVLSLWALYSAVILVICTNSKERS